MNIDDEIKDLRFKVSLLGTAVDFDAHPITSLVFELDWSEDQLNEAYDCFEELEKVLLDSPDKITTAYVENQFRDKIGVNYQTLKGIILAFYKEHRFLDVCIAYVNTFGGQPPLEYHRILRDIKST